MGEQNTLRLCGKKKSNFPKLFDPSFALQWQKHKPPLEAKGYCNFQQTQAT